jgi:hypothetical protein
MDYLVITSLICAVAGAAMLSRYNKAGSGFLLGGLLGPIGLIIAWTMRDNAKLDESAMRASATSPTEVRDERECPFCAERILRKATVCKHCGRDVTPADSDAVTTWECRCGAQNPLALKECSRCGRVQGAII